MKDEFDAFLECGILAHGFLRLRCADCGHDKRVAFSCKRRGFCASCRARRMAQTAAHLVDHVIPPVAVRRWVLSLPIPLRLLLAAQPQLVTPVLQVVHRVLTRFLLEQAGLKAAQAESGGTYWIFASCLRAGTWRRPMCSWAILSVTCTCNSTHAATRERQPHWYWSTRRIRHTSTVQGH